jgi:hypothetical protein
MFQLSAGETANLKSQFEVSSSQGVGDKRLPKNRSQFVTVPSSTESCEADPMRLGEKAAHYRTRKVSFRHA